jgi:hypothetical protein
LVLSGGNVDILALSYNSNQYQRKPDEVGAYDASVDQLCITGITEEDNDADDIFRSAHVEHLKNGPRFIVALSKVSYCRWISSSQMVKRWDL